MTFHPSCQRSPVQNLAAILETASLLMRFLHERFSHQGMKLGKSPPDWCGAHSAVLQENFSGMTSFWRASISSDASNGMQFHQMKCYWSSYEGNGALRTCRVHGVWFKTHAGECRYRDGSTSCSQDQTPPARTSTQKGPQTCACVRSWDHHSEFAVGLDWSVLQDGLLASAGWDQTVAVWHMSEMMVK